MFCSVLQLETKRCVLFPSLSIFSLSHCRVLSLALSRALSRTRALDSRARSISHTPYAAEFFLGPRVRHKELQINHGTHTQSKSFRRMFIVPPLPINNQVQPPLGHQPVWMTRACQFVWAHTRVLGEKSCARECNRKCGWRRSASHACTPVYTCIHAHVHVYITYKQTNVTRTHTHVLIHTHAQTCQCKTGRLQASALWAVLCCTD